MMGVVVLHGSGQLPKLSEVPDGYNTVLIVEVCSCIQGSYHRFFYIMRLPLQAIHGRSKNRESSLGKFGVPRPVTGSQPGFARNPCVPQLGFEPFVMSLNAPVKKDE